MTNINTNEFEFIYINNVYLQNNVVRRRNIRYVILNKCERVSLYKSVEVHTSVKAYGKATRVNNKMIKSSSKECVT